MIVFFVDAPQHLRIVEAALAFVPQNERIVLLTTVGMGDLVKLGARVECIDIATRPLVGSARVLQILAAGLRVGHAAVVHLHALELHIGAKHLVVMGDTGMPHRRLLDQANQLGWNTVLIQDGLVEVGYRESGRSFRFRRCVTAAMLRPLGLEWLGTTVYGSGGARRILVDGRVAASFFRNRCADAEVIVGGLLRPIPPRDAPKLRRLLFWAVDFLGGLSNEQLHERQLSQIVAIDRQLADSAFGVELVVRLHPRDLPYVQRFRASLAGCTCTTLQTPTEQRDPFGMGLPLASCSLQSAGVFDALAAGIPSVFIDDGDRFLGPAWVPSQLRMPASALTEWVQKSCADPGQRRQTWTHQTKGLAPAMLIPADAALVSSLWETP